MKMTVGRARAALVFWIFLAVLSVIVMCWRLAWTDASRVSETSLAVLVSFVCYYMALGFAFLSASRLKWLHDAQKFPETEDGPAGRIVSLAVTDEEAAKFNELVAWRYESKKSRRQIGATLPN